MSCRNTPIGLIGRWNGTAWVPYGVGARSCVDNGTAWVPYGVGVGRALVC